MLRTIVKLGKKGIIVLPKGIREAIGVNEGDKLVVKVEGDKLVLKPLKPLVVDVDPGVVREILRKERKLEEERIAKFLPGK